MGGHKLKLMMSVVARVSSSEDVVLRSTLVLMQAEQINRPTQDQGTKLMCSRPVEDVPVALCRFVILKFQSDIKYCSSVLH